ncbi:MAG: radical SAM protein [Muribaculaceae bacterium]|nr:radical SAM protein [Muribaculaceae bacterium]
MQTVLFHSTVFGPIHSRRLGTSLGINLSPDDGKICSFDCLYCEAGFNAQGPGSTGFPPRDKVRNMLQDRLEAMSEAGERLDVITFSGNGEPTLHPEFAGIIDDTIELRDRYFPQVKISVLTNSTRLADNNVAQALRRVDNNLLKLDSAVTDTMRLIDRPGSPEFTSQRAIELMSQFKGQCIVQTMILRGSYNGTLVDNTTPAEIEALIEAYRTIGPREVMIYSIDRKTPAEQLEKVPHEELAEIATHITAATGIPVQAS